jgi:hypothetical protein
MWGGVRKSHLTGSLQIRHPAVCVATYKRNIRQGTRVTDVKFRGDKCKCSHILQSDTTHVSVSMYVDYRSRPYCSAYEGRKPIQFTGASGPEGEPGSDHVACVFFLSR